MQEQEKVHKEQIKAANLEFKLKRAQKSTRKPANSEEKTCESAAEDGGIKSTNQDRMRICSNETFTLNNLK